MTAMAETQKICRIILAVRMLRQLGYVMNLRGLLHDATL
jgi:hypothetical protein